MLETDEKIPAVRRLVAKLAADVAADDPEALHQLVTLLDELQAMLPGVVEQMRADTDAQGRPQRGYSWAEIAHPFGITRDGAAKRFRR